MKQANHNRETDNDTWLRGAYNVIDRIHDLGVAIYYRASARLRRLASPTNEGTLRTQSSIKAHSEPSPKIRRSRPV